VDHPSATRTTSSATTIRTTSTGGRLQPHDAGQLQVVLQHPLPERAASETHTFTNNLLNNLILNYQREVALRGGPPGSPTSPPLESIISGSLRPAPIWREHHRLLSGIVLGVCRLGTQQLHLQRRPALDQGQPQLRLRRPHRAEQVRRDQRIPVVRRLRLQLDHQQDRQHDLQYPNAMANFQMGFMTSFTQGNFEQVNDRNHFPGIYAQDSWKITPRLTVNYGVRWEDFAPWANRNGNMQEFSHPTTQATSIQPCSPQPARRHVAHRRSRRPQEQRQQQVRPVHASRAGFAYDVFGDGKTVVRGGAGIFYQDRLPGFFNLSQASWVPITSPSRSPTGMYSTYRRRQPRWPIQRSVLHHNRLLLGRKLANPFPYTLPFPSTQTFPNGITLDGIRSLRQLPGAGHQRLQPDHRASTRSQLGRAVAYVGSVSRHQFVNLELNPSVNNGLGPATLGVNQRRLQHGPQRRPMCSSGTGCAANYSDIIDASHDRFAHFNSLPGHAGKEDVPWPVAAGQLHLVEVLDDMPQATRVNNTEDLNAGRILCVSSLSRNAPPEYPRLPMCPDIKALDRGLSDIDHPQAISFSYVYELPKLHQGIACSGTGCQRLAHQRSDPAPLREIP
jgi:hypothetical protein